MPGESRTSPRRIDATERQGQALDLRKSGASYQAIAKALGFRGRQGAAMAVQAALRKTIQEPADDLRKLDLERLDVMLLHLWPKVLRGDIRSIDASLRVLARRSLLLGLDAPLRVDVTALMEDEASRIAEATGQDKAELIAEAERIVEAAQR